MSMSYRLTAKKKRVTVRLELNEVPLWVWDDSEAVHITEELNPWITAGTNTLRVRVDWPEDESYAPETALADIRIEAVAADQDGGQRLALAEYAWPPKEEEEAYPSETVLQFDIAEPPPSRFWPDAQAIELTSEAEGEITDLVERLHASLAARDIDRLADLLDYRAVDIARSRYWPTTKARDSQRDFFHETLIEEPDWQLANLASEQLEMHFVAEGRLLWVTREDFQPALALTSPDDSEVAIELYLAPVAGNWTVIR